MKKTVLVLQHAAPEHLGLIAPALAAHGFEPRYVRIDQGEAVPETLGDVAALVVMGGPMGVYEREIYPHLAHELTLIAAALAAGLPTLGVCLGSQLLAAALGAPVTAGARKEIGWHELTLAPGAAADPVFAGLPTRLTGFHWHGDVYPLPAGATLLASSALTAVQAFRHGRAYGLLFHAEVTAAMVDEMARTFADELGAAGIPRAALGDGADPRLRQLNELASQLFGRWAAQIAGSR